MFNDAWFFCEILEPVLEVHFQDVCSYYLDLRTGTSWMSRIEEDGFPTDFGASQSF